MGMTFKAIEEMTREELTEYFEALKRGVSWTFSDLMVMNADGSREVSFSAKCHRCGAIVHSIEAVDAHEVTHDERPLADRKSEKVE